MPLPPPTKTEAGVPSAAATPRWDALAWRVARIPIVMLIGIVLVSGCFPHFTQGVIQTLTRAIGR